MSPELNEKDERWLDRHEISFADELIVRPAKSYRGLIVDRRFDRSDWFWLGFLLITVFAVAAIVAGLFVQPRLTLGLIAAAYLGRLAVTGGKRRGRS